MQKKKPKLTATELAEIPELISKLENDDLDSSVKQKIINTLLVVLNLSDNLEHSRITIAKLRELFGIKAKVLSKEVTGIH